MSGQHRMRRSIASIVAATTIATGVVAATPLAVPASQALAVFVVNDPSLDYETFSLTSCAAAQSCSLQDALQGAAQLLAGAETDVVIQFAPNVQGVVFQEAAARGTANPAHYYVTVPAGKTITVRGPATLAQQPIFDGFSGNRLFDFSGAGTIRLENLRMRNGGTNDFSGPVVGQGGSINTTAALTLDGVAITSSGANGAPANGGAVYATRDVTVRNSSITSSVGESLGGGIYIGPGAALVVDNSNISGNTNGGGGGNGGGVACDGCASVTVQGNSTFSGNNGRNGGGGVYLTGAGFVRVSGSTFSGNAAFNGNGAGISVESNAGGSVDIDNSVFTNNNAAGGSGSGGAVYCAGGGCGQVAVANSTFVNNSGFFGGALYSDSGATMFVATSMFTSNVSTLDGGAIFCNCLDGAVRDSLFDGNTGNGFGGGGAISVSGAEFRVAGSIFQGNSSSNNGALVSSGTLSVTTSIFRNNTG